MRPLGNIRLLLYISRSQDIARRYLVTNGFDGTLTMLGLVIGFHISGNPDLAVAISVCLAAAIALGMSGLSSAYVSESVERQKELTELEHAMVTELGNSAHAKAARLVPILIALVNGSVPVFFSLIIMIPLWLAHQGIALFISPYILASIVAFIIIFLLGVFLGRVSGIFWLWAGLRTVLVAVATSLLIFWIG